MKYGHFKISRASDRTAKRYALVIPLDDAQLLHTNIEVLNTLCRYDAHREDWYQQRHKVNPTEYIGTPAYVIACTVREVVRESNIEYRDWKAECKISTHPEGDLESPTAPPSNTVNRTNPQTEQPNSEFKLYQLVEVVEGSAGISSHLKGN